MTTELLTGTPTAKGRRPVMPAERIVGLRCRNCGRAEASGPNYVCPACFGPLEVAYDLELVGRLVDRAAIAARPPGIWRYLELLPVAEPPARGLTVGSTPLIAADRLGPTLGIDRLWIKDDTRNPTLSFKDRAVAIAATRALEFGLDTLACASTGNLAGATAAAAAAVGLPGVRLRPRRPRAGQDRPRPRLRRDGRPGRRHLRRRQPALPRGRRRARLGLRQRQPAAVLRRGQQDPRVRDRRGARLAAAGRRRRPDRVGRDVHQARQGLRRAGRASGSIERTPVRFVGGQAAGCAPVATAWSPRRDRHRAGPDPRHDRPLAGDRQPGRRALLGRAGPGDRRLDRGDPRRGHRGRDPAGRDRSRGSTRRRRAG